MADQGTGATEAISGSDQAAVAGGPRADDADLQESLAGLSRLAIGGDRQGLEDILTRIAALAVNAIPGADGAGLTLLEDDRADTVVATTELVRKIDAIQYELGEGPCITAAAEQRTVTSGSLGDENAFPRFGRQISRLGVHSVLSLPLVGTERVLGAMNVYARARDAFDSRAVELGELFAVPAAISVQSAHALFDARRVAAQLQKALTSRAVIDQAIGILMSRGGGTADEAFARLRVMSQADNQKLYTVAQSIVDEAVRRARARHAGS